MRGLVHRVVCLFRGHDWYADPMNDRLQFNYWHCDRCGHVTDNPFDVDRS